MGPDHWADLELRQLVALQAIAEAGSFWAAAERLDRSPSALSQQIATLEAHVGHRLIERSRGRRRVALTEPGRLLVRHADAIVARLRAARADLTAFGVGGIGSLRVGTFQSVGAKILPRALRRFTADWPKIDLQLVEEGTDDELLRRVEHGELDLSFCMQPLPDGPFEATVLMTDPWVLVVPADSDLARSRSARIAQLAGRPLVGFKLSRPIAHVEEHLRAEGVKLNVVFRSDDNAIVLGMVAAGVGCALMPFLALEGKDPAIHIVRLRDMPPRVLALAWHRERYRSPASIAFVERAVQVCRALSGAQRA